MQILLHFVISDIITFFKLSPSLVSCKVNHGSLLHTALVRFTGDDLYSEPGSLNDLWLRGSLYLKSGSLLFISKERTATADISTLAVLTHG